MNTLIIAEKPSVAANIAQALGARTKKDGYFTGNGYYVSFAFGHLYILANAKDYNSNMEKWNLKDYPFIPQKFIYKPINDSGVKKQIKIIKALADKSNIIINACDGDREGELIFSEIKKALNINKPIKRLWLTSHTPKDIKKGMANLKDDMINLEKAGYCRQQLDWLIGINFTVTYTLAYGNNVTLKVGRVMLPTLALVAQRETEIANFKPQNFYQLKLKFKSNNNESYTGIYVDKNNNTKFLNKDDLQIIKNATENKSGIIIKKENKKNYSYSPKLFNLTDLQGYITNKYSNFSADKVLNVVQSLYESKYVTYPRTASRFLDNSQIEDAKESLKSVLNLKLVDTSKVQFNSSKKIFDSSKVDSHPAIIPTYIIPDMNKLSHEQKIIYLEIVKRFISQFMDAAIYDTVEIITRVDSYDFITKGKVLVDLGWKELYKNDKDNNNNNQVIKIKNIKENTPVVVMEQKIKDGITNPPAHYTEQTLLKAMENCGKNVEDEDSILKGFTIGTSATRAETIKKLIKCNYIEKKGKNLLITPIGVKVINYFPIKELLKVNFTGTIEKTLKDIENGKYDANKFMSKMNTFIRTSVEQIKLNNNNEKISTYKNIIGKCPDCGNNVIENSKAFSCENKNCKFVLFKNDKFLNSFGKKMTKKIATELILKQQTKIIGMKSKNKKGKKFNAILSIEKDHNTKYWKYNLKFENNK